MVNLNNLCNNISRYLDDSSETPFFQETQQFITNFLYVLSYASLYTKEKI